MARKYATLIGKWGPGHGLWQSSRYIAISKHRIATKKMCKLIWPTASKEMTMALIKPTMAFV